MNPIHHADHYLPDKEMAAKERKEHKRRHFLFAIFAFSRGHSLWHFRRRSGFDPAAAKRLWRGKKDFGYFEKSTPFFEKRARFRKNFEFYFFGEGFAKATVSGSKKSKLLQVNPS